MSEKQQKTKRFPAMDLISRILISLSAGLMISLIVVYLLENIIFYSLFIGIPVGLISFLIIFFLLSRYF